MKKILLITPLWTGAAEFFLHGQEKFVGMPGFVNVFLELLNRGNNVHVYLFIASRWKRKEVSFPSKYSNLKVTPIYFDGNIDLLKKSYSVVKELRKLCKSELFDLVYGQGSVGALVSFLPKKFIKKTAQRIYGTFLIDEIQLPKWKLFLKHPLEYLAFSRQVDHCIITNDGTHGDKVFEYLGNKKSRLHFLLNGVDRSNLNSNSYQSGDEKVITYVARVDQWKRQHLAIEVAKELKKMGASVPFKVIGPIHNESYYVKLKGLVEEYNLDNIEFTGAMEAKEVYKIQEKAYLSLSFYDTSNLGNVFLEGVYMGVPMVAINSNLSLDQIDSKAFVKCNTDNPKELAKQIFDLVNNEEARNVVSRDAIKYSKNELKDWEERVNFELNLLLN